MTTKPDIATSCEGSLWIFLSKTAKGKRWLTRNVEGSENGAATAEHRYGMDIACGALRDGLRLQDTATGRFAMLPEDAA